MDQGQHLDGHAHPEPFRAGRNSTGHHDRRRQYRAVRQEMALAQPGGIQSHIFGQIHQLKRFLETLLVCATAADGKVDMDAKVHDLPPDCHCDVEVRYFEALYTHARFDPNTAVVRFSVGMVGHTVVSMTWVWQELSDEGLSRGAMELLKDLVVCLQYEKFCNSPRRATSRAAPSLHPRRRGRGPGPRRRQRKPRR